MGFDFLTTNTSPLNPVPERSLRDFFLYVILTISYLRAQTIETSSLPTDSSRPLFEQIEISSSMLTVYLNCKYCP